MAAGYVKLNNGAMMPLIGLGTWKSKKGEVGKTVKLALHHGYRHIDCAHIYVNEAEIGDALNELFQEGKLKREDLFITSKLWSNSHAPEDVLPACQTTLKNLQIDYLDLYLIHTPLAFTKDAPMRPQCIADGVLGYSSERIAKTWKAMEQLVEQGLCKAIGISNFTIKKTKDLLETAKIVPACNQVEWHPYFPQPALKEFCDSKGIVITAYSPLGSPDRPYPNKEALPVLLNDPVLKEIAKKHTTTVALVALAWGTTCGVPVLPKAVSENHLKENLEALRVKLDDDDIEAIKNIGVRYRYIKINWMFKPDEIPKDLWDGED
ncbi:aldo-keto reductase family 1 member A1-like isoform X1 [Montipora foliosa]|uniref:aldo-keto reductase family 1 member A1-like isoform X1 n=1 Tax=Montipora foliosa TaxID=591990 RepID=UPI0035F21155